MQNLRTINKRYTIGPADSVICYMFLIAWTTAKVVKVQIKQDFKLTSYKVSNIRGEYTVIEIRSITVKAGQVLYFAKSGMNQMYYLTSVDGCSCKAGRFHQRCHHVDDVTAFVDSRKPAASVVTSEVTTDAIETQHGTTIHRGTTVYRVDGQILFWDDLMQDWFCTCQETVSGVSYGCEHGKHVQTLLDFIAQEQVAA